MQRRTSPDLHLFEAFRGAIKTPNATFDRRWPKPTNVRIDIKAIPLVISEETVQRTLEKYIGGIPEFNRVYQKGTRIFNGYRTIVVRELTAKQIDFRNLCDSWTQIAKCSCLLDEHQDVERSNRCQQPGREINQCPNQTVSLNGRQKGHKSYSARE